jgi:hypothetical protein
VARHDRDGLERGRRRSDGDRLRPAAQRLTADYILKPTELVEKLAPAIARLL